MTVLVLAGEFDISADQLVLELRDRMVPVCRVDTAWFPAQLSLDAELRGGCWRGRLRMPGRDVELEGLRSVWYRSPSTFQFPAELSGAERHHAFLEAKYGLGGVLSSLTALWVNHPARAAAASKPVQLATAAWCGLTVPDTLITNEPDAMRRFAQKGPTVAIHAGNAVSHVDFRADYDALTYEPVELPIDVVNGIKRFLSALGLVYGALDFVVGPDGSYTFLECNSGGQFGWLEARTGTPLTAALADLLATGTQS